jgi:Astacin (Peptidase family M12A)
MQISTLFKLCLPVALAATITACPGNQSTPGFTLVAPTNNSVEQGSSIVLSLKVEPNAGFNSAVTLKLDDLPVGVTAVFDPPAVQAGSSGTLRLTAGIGAITGAAKLSLTGEGNGSTNTSKIDLNVTVPKNYVELAAPNPNNPGKVVKLPVLVSGGVGIYQGDILFPAGRVIGKTNQLNAKGTVMQPGYCAASFIFCVDRAHLWPNNTVPYAFDSSATPALRTLVEQAAQVYFERAAIRFIPRSNEDDYLVIKGIPLDSTEGGSSYIGRLEGAQDLNLRIDATLGVALHEFGHALGLWHEQSRPDRDQWVRILPDNIQDKFKNNFELKDDPDVARANGPYDFGSIMHYGLNAFSKNNQPTIQVKNPAGVDLTQIGQRGTLSAGDILALADLYNAPVTDGSIGLRIAGSRDLIAGGSRQFFIDVFNSGPRTMTDLYFGLSAKFITVTATNTSSLQCGLPTGNAKDTTVCYAPGGILSGARKTYGPITIKVDDDLTTGGLNINLSLRPIGTRLANPAKALSTVKLCNIRPIRDAGESDSFNTPLAALALDQNPPAGTSRVPTCESKFLERYTLDSKNDIDYFSFDASDAGPRNVYSFGIDGGPDFEILEANGTPVSGKEISRPGKYVVKVFGNQASLYTISPFNTDPELTRLLNATLKRYQQKLDPKGPIRKRLVEETLNFGLFNNSVDAVANKGVSYFTVTGENLTLKLFDAENTLISEQKSNTDNTISVQLPGSDNTKAYRAELGRQNNEQTLNGVTVEQPEQAFTIEAFRQ